MIRPLSTGLFLAFSAALPSFAAESYDAPAGKVEIVTYEDGMKGVRVGPEDFPLDDFYAGLHGRYGDLVLVRVSSGGTACPATFRWLHVSKGDVRISESFGTCSDHVDVVPARDRIAATMPSLDPSRGDVSFVYDGTSIDEVLIGLKGSGVDGSNPSAWAGKPISDYLSDPYMEPALLSLMSWQELEEVRRSSLISSYEGMKVQGDWVVGEGCRPHDCADESVALGIHVPTGDPVLSIRTFRQKPRLVGSPAAALPNAVRDHLTR